MLDADLSIVNWFADHPLTQCNVRRPPLGNTKIISMRFVAAKVRVVALWSAVDPGGIKTMVEKSGQVRFQVPEGRDNPSQAYIDPGGIGQL
jgi:hypothetical protein